MTSTPLNLLDELYLNLDRDLEPWTVHYELQLGIRLDADRLAGAIATAARRHPLARARLAPWRFQDRGYDWNLEDELLEPRLKLWVGESDAIAAERERLFSVSPSLSAAPPFVIALIHGTEGDALLLNLHHAAGDGISAERLMLSIIRAYAGEEDPMPPLDLLTVRDVRPLAAARSAGERRARTRTLAGAAWRPFVPTARVARDGSDDRPAYGFELFQLSKEESGALFASAVDGATVNDVLLAALAVTIVRWNAEHGHPPRPVALSMPVNLRPDEWRHEILSNFASWVTVWVAAGTDEGVSSVTPRVAARTRIIKRDRLGGMAVDLLGMSGKLMIATKRWLQHMKVLTADAIVDTASLSNLGRLESLPPLFDGADTAVWFSPPSQMPLGVGVGVVTLADRLHVTIRYRHAQFDAPAAQRFAALYRAVLCG